MTVMSEGLLLNSNYSILKWVARRVVSFAAGRLEARHATLFPTKEPSHAKSVSNSFQANI